MHILQACLFKYITVCALRIYALHGEDAAKKGGGCALNSHGNYIFDHGKAWKNHGIVFLNSCGNPERCILAKILMCLAVLSQLF